MRIKQIMGDIWNLTLNALECLVGSQARAGIIQKIFYYAIIVPMVYLGKAIQKIHKKWLIEKEKYEKES